MSSRPDEREQVGVDAPSVRISTRSIALRGIFDKSADESPYEPSGSRCPFSKTSVEFGPRPSKFTPDVYDELYEAFSPTALVGLLSCEAPPLKFCGNCSNAWSSRVYPLAIMSSCVRESTGVIGTTPRICVPVTVMVSIEPGAAPSFEAASAFFERTIITPALFVSTDKSVPDSRRFSASANVKRPCRPSDFRSFTTSSVKNIC